jgi:hypothetical protein
MIGPFSVFTDALGNLYMQAGTVIALNSTTTYFTVGNQSLAIPFDDATQKLIQSSQTAGGFFGGAGNNVQADTAVLGTLVPAGLFVPAAPDSWQSGTLTMDFDSGTGAAEISDGTDIVATASGMTIAPSGTFTATTYGRTTYNSGTAFTVATTYEGGDPYPGRGFTLEADGSTVQEGVYNRTGWQTWESADDPDWTMTIDGTGAAVINDSTDDVLTRAADATLLYDPTSGGWESTAYGETTYGGGEFFYGQTALLRAYPIAGYLYVTLTINGSDEVTGVTGPFFAASLPANSSTAVSVPIAYSNGTGTVTQIQLGPITWRPA